MDTSFILCRESNMAADLSFPTVISGDDVDELNWSEIHKLAFSN